jgi:hypothetical protein
MKIVAFVLVAIVALVIVGTSFWVGLHTGSKNTIAAYEAGYLEIDTSGGLIIRTDPVNGWRYPDIPITGNKVIFVPVPSKVQKISLEDEDEIPVQAGLSPAMSSLVLPGCGQVKLSVIKFDAAPELYASHSVQVLFDACKEKYGWKALSSLSDANLLPRHLLNYDRGGKGLYFFFRPAGSSHLIQVGQMTNGGGVKELGSPMLGGLPITQMVQDGSWICVQ